MILRRKARKSMSEIIQELKKIILKAGLPVSRNKLRGLLNPKLFDMAIEATRKTGDPTWINLARSRCGLSGIVTIEKIAKACHENHNLLNVSFGDPPRAEWEAIPPNSYQKIARYNNIRRLVLNPLTLPSTLHNEWVKQARMQIDAHPDFKEFGELPEKQRKKSEIFHAMASSLICMLDEKERQATCLSCVL